jgi:transcriptional regulator with XRE-family HTH domain
LYTDIMARPILYIPTPSEVSLALGERVKTLRLLKGWKRQTLADRAGVSAASLRRFEATGKASLELVLRTAHALGRLTDFSKLLAPPPARSIAELEQRAAPPTRKRGRI